MEILDRIRIVLVNPVHSGNIGGAARAMKNMGLDNLWLVAPQRFPDPEATWRAASATDVLDAARVVPTLDEAIAGCGLVVGTSARERRIPWPVCGPRECAGELLDVAARQPVAILFGREDYGLSNDELQRCNLHVTIPTHDAYSSLNLAMAVQIIAYEIFSGAQARTGNAAVQQDWDQPLATAGDLELLYTHLEQTAIRTGFLDPARPRMFMPRMRRLFGRVRMDAMELNILRGLLAAMTEHHAGRNGEVPPGAP